jgi:hypothetical protein
LHDLGVVQYLETVCCFRVDVHVGSVVCEDGADQPRLGVRHGADTAHVDPEVKLDVAVYA